MKISRRPPGVLSDLVAYGWRTGRWATVGTILLLLVVTAFMIIAAMAVPAVVYTLF